MNRLKILTPSGVSMRSSSSSSCRGKTLTEKACDSSLLSSILRCDRRAIPGRKGEERGVVERGRGRRDGGQIINWGEEGEK